MAAQRTYLAIDLKSFYASVECVDRHLDPLTTNLVVADASRTEKTICLAVSPSLKAYKIPGRARLFEAVQRVKEVGQVLVALDQVLDDAVHLDREFPLLFLFLGGELDAALFAEEVDVLGVVVTAFPAVLDRKSVV